MQKQQGVALLSVLITAALVGMIAYAVTSNYQRLQWRTAGMLHLTQTQEFVWGAEAFATWGLNQDRQAGEIDHAAEQWSAPVILPLEDGIGVFKGQIQELHGRFNINNLLADNSQLYIDQLRRILTALELEPDLSLAIADWIDEDVEVRFPAGAEDDSYLRLTPAYRAANQPMASITELRLVAGITPEIYDKLLPHVTALPTGSKLNINTATAIVLQALGADITAADAEGMINSREKEPFEAVDDFLQLDELAGREIDATVLDVASQYFVADIKVEIGSTDIAVYSLIFRDGTQPARVIARSQGFF